MLHIFCNDFSSVSGSSTSVLDACFKGFICLQMYVLNVSSRCFKSRSGVASFLLLAFCYLALVSPLPDADWASIAPSPLDAPNVLDACFMGFI
jgi:hypothetical protein